MCKFSVVRCPFCVILGLQLNKELGSHCHRFPFSIPKKGVRDMATRRLNIKVSEDMYNWIADQAEKRALSLNSVVVLALETYATQQVVTGNLPELLAAYNEMKEKGEI